MSEAKLHARTTFHTKGGFLSATPFLQKFDFLIDLGINWKRKEITSIVSLCFVGKNLNSTYQEGVPICNSTFEKNLLSHGRSVLGVSS
jgi:hypothetical protein